MARSQALRDGAVVRDVTGAPQKKSAKNAVKRIVAATRTRKKPPSDGDDQRNIILARFSTEQTDFTRNPLDLSKVFPIDQGSLVYPNGDRTDELTKRERLTAVMGPGSTIQGVAQVVRNLINTKAKTALTEDEVAIGLTEYNSWVMKRAGQLVWQVGVRLPLPIEVVVVQGQQRLVVDAATLRALAKAHKGAMADATNNPVADLPLPNFNDVTIAVLRDNHAPPADRGIALAAKLVENPFLLVFEAIETMRQYAGGPFARSSDEQAFAEALVNAVPGWELDQLAGLTAGNAILRRLWRAVRPDPHFPATPATVLDPVGHALGLHKDPDGTWHDPTFYFVADQEAVGATPDPKKVAIGPSVVPLELAVPENRRSMVDGAKLIDDTHDHTMVLGRDIDVGLRTLSTKQNISGVQHPGTAALDPKNFTIPTSDIKDPIAVRSRLRVVVAIAPNDGMLDSVRSADPGLLSFGIQQWSCHVNTEASALLHRYRLLAPDHFDLFFGLYGLQTVLTGAATSPELPDPEGAGRATAVAANPTWVNNSPSMDPGGPEHVTFRQVKPGLAANDDDTALPVGSQERKNYFGFTQTGSTIVMANDWSGRCRLTALASQNFVFNQLEFGTLRFERKIATQPIAVLNTGKRATLAELFSSDFGAAVVMDTHVKDPAVIDASIARAIARTTGIPVAPNGDLNEDWLCRLEVNFMAGRGVSADVIDNRNAHLLRVYEASLQAVPGLFLGW